MDLRVLGRIVELLDVLKGHSRVQDKVVGYRIRSLPSPYYNSSLQHLGASRSSQPIPCRLYLDIFGCVRSSWLAIGNAERLQFQLMHFTKFGASNS